MLCKMKGFELFSSYLSSAFYFYNFFLVRKSWCCHCFTLFSSLQKKKELKKKKYYDQVLSTLITLYSPSDHHHHFFFFIPKVFFGIGIQTLWYDTRWWWWLNFSLYPFFSSFFCLHLFFPPNMWNIIQYMFSHLISKKNVFFLLRLVQCTIWQFWLLTGTIGFYAALFFVRRIYAAVKID